MNTTTHKEIKRQGSVRLLEVFSNDGGEIDKWFEITGQDYDGKYFRFHKETFEGALRLFNMINEP